jgi:hypothetical protein
MDVQICQLCKEPIQNYVSLRALGNEIESWLPTEESVMFRKFHTDFLHTFRYPDRPAQHHIITNRQGPMICIYCYVNEVFQWLSGVNGAVAKRFRRFFSFGMRKEDFREIIISHAQPVTEGSTEAASFGICDSCGEYADELAHTDGGLLCEGCCHGQT